MEEGRPVKILRWPLAAVAASAALVGAYLALGGRSYAPAAVPDPCTPRHWHAVHNLSDIENEVALSALDGAACRLGVSQPTLALAFTSTDRLDRFEADHHLSSAQVADATKAGLLRAISDGQRSGAINGIEAFVLRTAADQVPEDQLIRLVRGLLG
jgi:hypothetical protein